MHDLPQARDLLGIARSSLLDELLQHLPAAQKYTALMVSNAMAIASREQANVNALMQARQTLLQHAGECVGKALDDRLLCQAVRAGAFDNQLISLLPLLHADVSSRLQVSNPRYLEAVQHFQAQDDAVRS